MDEASGTEGWPKRRTYMAECKARMLAGCDALPVEIGRAGCVVALGAALQLVSGRVSQGP